MEIRLAFAQGLLSGRNPNAYQKFALRYAINMNRRVELQTIEDTLQKQTWYLEPKRYTDLFLAGAFEPEPFIEDGSLEEEVDDLDEIDKFFDEMESQRVMTGADLFAHTPDEEGWV